METDTTTTKKAGIALVDAVNPLVWRSWKRGEDLGFNVIKIVAFYFMYRMVRGK